MKVLDASFLIDYEHGREATAQYLPAHDDDEFVIPSPVYGEYLLGEANAAPDPNLARVRAELDWTEVWPVSKETVDLGLARVAELPANAPHLDGVDVTVVGVSEEVGAPIVAGESDFTHEAVRAHLDIERYRQHE